MPSTISRNDAEKVICEFRKFITHLSTIKSEIELINELYRFFLVEGEINYVASFDLDHKVSKLEDSEFRRFIVIFKRKEDANKVINLHKLSSFGYGSVIVKIKRQLPLSPIHTIQ
jgi:hypothetical protein